MSKLLAHIICSTGFEKIANRVTTGIILAALINGSGAHGTD